MPERHLQPPHLSLQTDDSNSPFQRPRSLSVAKSVSSAKTMEEHQEALWLELNEFYTQNQVAIERAAAMDVTIDKMSEVDMALETFVETASTLLPGLVGLANIHPGLGVAVFAFAGVINLDMARRGNNRKVLAVNLQMQNMMCAMFQLRKLRHIHVEEPEREEEQTRLHRLIKDIAHEIKVCGSDLDYYMDRKFVSKLINAKTYEHRFAQHVDTFARRRSELQSTITAYIAAGVDAANLGIAEVQDKLGHMDYKLEEIMQALRNLDTPREREMYTFIENNGGADKCISKDDLLVKLLLKSGDSSTSVAKGQDLAEIRQSLRSELDERLDKVLDANVPRFEKLLKVQSNNLDRILDKIENQGYEISDHSRKLDKLVTTTISILEEEKLIRKATAPIMSIPFTDPVLKFIWDRMGLKGSVKAKTFVLTFRDHILGQDEPFAEFATPVVPRHTIYTPFSNLSPSISLLHSELEDQWALKYIDVSHVQPVIEAIDEDGSGFISVKEANTFAISRPKNWSFLRWVAYWAAGWHVNITSYRTKVYVLAQQIHQALFSVHPANRSYAEEYMSNKSFNALEALLRSVTPLPDSTHVDSKLADIANSMSTLMESRLMMNLDEMSFVLESPATVNLVVGSGRIETRHLDIMRFAQSRIIHEKEFTSHSKTLESIFSLFNDRIEHLQSIFRTHVNHDEKAQFEKFAFGMFAVAHAEKHAVLSKNTLLTYKDDKVSLSRMSDPHSNPEPIPTSILTKGSGPEFEFDEIDIPSFEAMVHPMEGLWTGQCIRTNNSRIAFQGFFQFNIDPIVNGILAGKGETYLGEVEFRGEVKPDLETHSGLFNVELRIDSSKYADLWCSGQYDPVRESISGKWVVDDDSGDFPPMDEAEERQLDLRLPCGHFYITRTPASVYRFRWLLDNHPHNTFPNLARQRWAFAIEAVRFQTQQRFSSWTFLRARAAERREWMKLTMQRELDKISPTSKPQLSDEGKDRLFALRLTVHPTIGRFYDSLSNYFFKRMAFTIGPYSCYICGRRIIFSRYHCITCMDDNFSNQLDLCEDCIDIPFPGGAFEHHESHSLIRSTRRIFDCEMASIILQARSSSGRVKSLFNLGSDLHHGVSPVAKPEFRMPRRGPTAEVLPCCDCCGQAISLPCWVCVICSLVHICMSCQRQRSPLTKRKDGIANGHSFYHPLLRISDKSQVEAAELKTTRLERQLQDLNGTILALSQKIDTQLGTSRMQELTRHSLEQQQGVALVDRDAELVPVASIQEKIARSRTTANFNAKRKRAEDAVSTTRFEERMLALENKVDRQFAHLLSLVQQLVPPSPRSGAS